MKRIVIYRVLLLSIGLFVNSGWVKTESDVISFIAKKDGSRSICLVSARGEILQKLMTAPEYPAALTWSPDGDLIAYHSNQGGNLDIYVMDMRKKTHRQLTFHGGRDLWPAWSPNGKWIVFVSEREAEMDLYKMDVNGENVKRLTNLGGCGRPAWSPDNRWIVFASAPAGRPYSLFIMSSEGRKLRTLKENIALPGCTWSPDSKQIAFVSWDAEGGTDIFSMNINGRNLRQRTWSDPRALIFSPVWSPSGKWIAYVLAQMPVVLKPALIDQNFDAPVICVVNTADGVRGEPLEATRGLTGNTLEWTPQGFFSVSPSREKRMTFWGELKQLEK